MQKDPALALQLFFFLCLTQYEEEMRTGLLSETSVSLHISELTSRWGPASHEPHRDLGGVGGAWGGQQAYRSEEHRFQGGRR